MILGLEIGMLIAGILALTRGRMELTPSIVAEGVAARLLGILAMTPLPAAIIVLGAYTVANCAGKSEPEIDAWVKKEKTNMIIIEAGVVLGIALLVVGGIAVFGDDPKSRPDQLSELDPDERYSPPSIRGRAVEAAAYRAIAGPNPAPDPAAVVRCPKCDGGVRLDRIPPGEIVTCQWCNAAFKVEAS